MSSYRGAPRVFPASQGRRKKEGRIIPRVQLPFQVGGNEAYAFFPHSQYSPFGATQNPSLVLSSWSQNFIMCEMALKGFCSRVIHSSNPLTLIYEQPCPPLLDQYKSSALASHQTFDLVLSIILYHLHGISPTRPMYNLPFRHMHSSPITLF